MTIRVNNLYQHADGDFYCLLSDTTPMKCPVTGDWLDGVVYSGADGEMRSTTTARWLSRFSPVAEYPGDDESVIAMIRRANPGSLDFDFMTTLESWHESEMGITGHALELAIAATAEAFVNALAGTRDPARLEWDEGSTSITITTEDLQRIVQTYEIERVPVPGGFQITMRK